MNIQGATTWLASVETVYDPGDGDQLRMVYRGDTGTLQTAAAAWRATGARATLVVEAGVGELHVYLGRSSVSSTGETPTDKWTFRTDYTTEPIWSHPGIVNALAGEAATLGLSQERYTADLRGLIEAYLKGKRWNAETSEYDQVAGGPRSPADTTFSGFALKLYNLMLLGSESFEVERPVIARVRSYSAAYVSRRVIPAMPKVYSTSKLISNEGIPSVIQSQMPGTSGNAVPTYKPTDTQWSWKERSHNIDVDWTGKVTESTEWVFAAWHTLLYDYVT